MTKKLFICTAALLLSAKTHAQLAIAPEIGVGISDMRFAPILGFTAASTKPLPAFKIGAAIEAGFNKHVYLQSGLFFATKGQQRSYSFYDSDTLNDQTNQTLNLYYIDAPVSIFFKTGQQGSGRVIFGLGATFSYLVTGTNMVHSVGVNGTPFDVSYSSTIKTGGNNWSPWDLGINLTGGYELPTGLYFKIYYTAGLKDLGLNTEMDKNRIFGLSAGYFFGKGRNINKEADDLIER